MHTLQKLLITRLVTQNGRSFSSLTRGYDSEDNIVFHLKQLLADDLIEKHDDKYFITATGINTLSTFQKTDLKDNAFKMFYVGFVCNCTNDYLIKPHTNTKETFYNLPSGSPLFGESLQDALPRIFYTEMGIRKYYADCTFDSLHMKTVITKGGKILFDDASGVYKITVTKEERGQMTLKNGCVWVNKSEIANLNNKWPEIDMCILEKNWHPYNVYTVTCDYVLR